MILYTPDQVYDLMEAINCRRDVIELQRYFIEYGHRYSDEMQDHFLNTISVCLELFDK